MPIDFVKPLILIVFYVAFALLAWRRLNWAVLLAIAALPSYLIRFHLGPIPATLLEGMLLIIIAAAIFHRVRKVRAEIVPTQNYKALLSKTLNFPLRARLALPLGLFLLTATIALFIAPDLRAAAGAWKAYFIEPILFFVILLDLLIHHPHLLNRRQIIGALSVSALLLSLYSIYQRFTGFGIPPPWNAELRVTSIFPYPNALGLFLAPLVPLFIARFQVSGFRFQKSSLLYLLSTIYYLLVALLSMTAIIFAKSTGALVGVAAGLLFMWVIIIIKQHKQKFFILYSLFFIFTLAVLATLAILASPSLKDELTLRDWSGHVRHTQWSETIEMLKDTSTPLGAGRPILGTGLAGYKEALEPYHKAAYLEIFEYPHNIVLNFWSETGLLGLIAFTWLIVLFFRQIRNKLLITNYQLPIVGAAAAMVTMLVHGLVDVPYFKNDLAILFWIVYAIGVVNNKNSYATSH